MKIIRDAIILSGGRVLSANRNIIGINDELELFDGYDGGLETSLVDKNFKPIPLTPEERKELAEYMIDLWMRWLKEGPPHPLPWY